MIDRITKFAYILAITSTVYITANFVSNRECNRSKKIARTEYKMTTKEMLAYDEFVSNKIKKTFLPFKLFHKDDLWAKKINELEKKRQELKNKAYCDSIFNAGKKFAKDSIAKSVRVKVRLKK